MSNIFNDFKLLDLINFDEEMWAIGDLFTINCSIFPPSGIYPPSTTIEITANVPGPTIYYTTDGSDPNTGSSVYSTSIPVFNGTLKAYAVASGYDDSDIVSATYTISSADNQPIVFIIT